MTKLKAYKIDSEILNNLNVTDARKFLAEFEMLKAVRKGIVEFESINTDYEIGYFNGFEQAIQEIKLNLKYTK